MGNNQSDSFVCLGTVCVRRTDVLRLDIQQRCCGEGWKVVLFSNAGYVIDEAGSTILEQTLTKTTTLVRAKQKLKAYSSTIADGGRPAPAVENEK